MLEKFYDVIIINAGTDLKTPHQRAWLRKSNTIFLSSSPVRDSLFAVSGAINQITGSKRLSAKQASFKYKHQHSDVNSDLSINSDKLNLIINRADVDSGFNLEQLVQELFPWMKDRQKFWMPNVANQMLVANNRGVLLVDQGKGYELEKYKNVIERIVVRALSKS